MTPPARRVDHVTFGASSLDHLIEPFRALGLDAQYGGAHANGITHMAAVGLPDGSYLELISTVEPAIRSPWWPEAIRGDAGPCGFAPATAGPFHGVAQVVLAVHDSGRAAGRFTRAFGWRAGTPVACEELGASLVPLVEGPVVLAEPFRRDGPARSRVDRFGESPLTFLLDAAGDPPAPFDTEVAWPGGRARFVARILESALPLGVLLPTGDRE